MQEIAKHLDYSQRLMNYLSNPDSDNLLNCKNSWIREAVDLDIDEFHLYHINKITFEEKAPRREALENILSTFRGMDNLRFIYMILGSVDHVDFYFGIAKESSDGESTVKGLAENLLAPSIRGNFRGSRIKSVDSEKSEILNKLCKAKCCAMLEGVPGIDRNKDNVQDSSNNNFQGTDRLVNTMFGSEFGFVVIAKPCAQEDVYKIEKNLYEIYDKLTPMAKHSLQYSHSNITNKSDNINYTYTKQNSYSSQTGKSISDTKANNTANDERTDQSNQVQAVSNENVSEQHSNSRNRTSSTTDINNPNSNTHRDTGENVNNGVSKNYISSKSNNISSINTFSSNKSSVYSLNHSESDTQSNSESHGENISDSTAKISGSAENENRTRIEQLEIESKQALNWLKYIDEVLLPRVDNGKGKGLFLACTYLFSNEDTVLSRLANTAISLYSGAGGNRAALKVNYFDVKDKNKDFGCVHALQNFAIPATIKDKSNNRIPDSWKSVHSCYADKDFCYCGSWMSADELAIISGLPQKEVIGLSLRREVEFGLNTEVIVDKADRIELGYLVQSGEVVQFDDRDVQGRKNVSVYLDRKDLDKHTFITGVTGSGKTTTCQNILLDCNLPFLVIEPAKTEYRKEFFRKHFYDIIYFTPGRQNVAPFFLNPFELFPGEAITSRADMLKATMEASFAMEAAIPQIMETAIYRVYEDKGWNIGDNTWRDMDENDLENGPFADGVYAFPTLSDFLEATIQITKEQGFDERLRDEYIGSLRARIQGLLVGAKGMTLNTPRSVDFGELINKHVVIELEEIKNGEEKSLIMGFILTNLIQAVKAKHKVVPEFQHITLVEEAHRLLSRYTPGDSMNKRQGVEVFADMLAEVRKYGESLIIVDQIPEKMTPEVLKNTNTKIVHKLFAKDDKDVIGNTMALEDIQKDFLSNLDTGKAIVFTQGWTKAIQVKIKKHIADEDNVDIDEENLTNIALNYYRENYKRGILRGLEKISMEKVTDKLIKNYLWLIHSDQSLKLYKELLNEYETSGAFSEKMGTILSNFAKKIELSLKKMNGDKELLLIYFYYNIYEEYPDKENESLRAETFKNFVERVIDNKNFDNDVELDGMCNILRCKKE